jgi:hypothetical protein
MTQARSVQLRACMELVADQKTVSGPVRSNTPIPSNARKSARRASGSSFVLIGRNPGICVIADKGSSVHLSITRVWR